MPAFYTPIENRTPFISTSQLRLSPGNLFRGALGTLHSYGWTRTKCLCCNLLRVGCKFCS